MTKDELVASMKAIVEGAEGRSLTDDEVTQYESYERDLAALNRTEQLRARQEAYETPVAGPSVATATTKEDPHTRALADYIRTAEKSAELVQYRAQSKLTDAAGGYLVPDGFRNKLIEEVEDLNPFAAAAETITTSSGNTIEWPIVSDAGTAAIVAENGAITTGADLVFDIDTLGAYKYATVGASNLPLKVSWELLQDSVFDIEALIRRRFARRIAELQATHWITGDGSGEPLGLLTPKTAYDAIASNAAGPTYPELVATVHALHQSYRRNAKWLMSDATLAVLRSMVDDNGRPLYQDAISGLSGAMPGGTLLGFPVIIDDAMPDIGDATKFLAFGDFRQAYVIRRVKNFELVVMREVYAPNGQVGYIGWDRADGTVQDPNAYVVLGGEDTA